MASPESRSLEGKIIKSTSEAALIAKEGLQPVFESGGTVLIHFLASRRRVRRNMPQFLIEAFSEGPKKKNLRKSV